MKRFLTLSALSLWLTGAAAFSIACLSAGPVFAQRSASFAGRWTGYWENSLGERGDDSLDLSEDRDGNLSGVWTGDVQVAGEGSTTRRPNYAPERTRGPIVSS